MTTETNAPAGISRARAACEAFWASIGAGPVIQEPGAAWNWAVSQGATGAWEAAAKAATAAEAAKIADGTALIARTLDRLARTMEAARIEMQQSGPEKAMQWILGASEWPEDDGQGLAWDGKETARAWFDRVMAAEEPAS